MGIFLDQVEVFNRAPVDLVCRFDGQAKILHPGKNVIPAITVDLARNQNPIMGSGDPYNPHISGARYLVGVVGRDECEPLTKEEWEDHLQRPCRDDEQIQFRDKYGSDPKAKLVTHGKGRKTTANSRYDAGASIGASNSEFSRKD